MNKLLFKFFLIMQNILNKQLFYSLFNWNYALLWIHKCFCIYIYIYIYICVCVCMYIYTHKRIACAVALFTCSWLTGMHVFFWLQCMFFLTAMHVFWHALQQVALFRALFRGTIFDMPQTGHVDGRSCPATTTLCNACVWV